MSRVDSSDWMKEQFTDVARHVYSENSLCVGLMSVCLYVFLTLMRSPEVFDVYLKLVVRRLQRSASYVAIRGTRINIDWRYRAEQHRGTHFLQ